MKMQMSLFSEEKEEFKHRSRGKIYNERIWPELSTHQKINIRSYINFHGRTYQYKNEICPSYYILNNCFEQGLDKSPFSAKKGIYSLFFMLTGTRKFLNT